MVALARPGTAVPPMVPGGTFVDNLVPVTRRRVEQYAGEETDALFPLLRQQLSMGACRGLQHANRRDRAFNLTRRKRVHAPLLRFQRSSKVAE